MSQESAPLAIASVTAVLRELLGNALIKNSSLTRLGDVNVSVLPPDRITVGSDEAKPTQPVYVSGNPLHFAA